MSNLPNTAQECAYPISDGGFAEKFLEEMLAALAARSPEEVRDDVASAALGSLVAIGMLHPESAAALLSLWRRRDYLTPIELDAINTALADATCAGAPTGFVAECGEPGPHGEHPYGEQPRRAVRCFASEPHEPHRTTFAPETGIANGWCSGVGAGRVDEAGDRA